MSKEHLKDVNMKPMTIVFWDMRTAPRANLLLAIATFMEKVYDCLEKSQQYETRQQDIFLEARPAWHARSSALLRSRPLLNL